MLIRTKDRKEIVNTECVESVSVIPGLIVHIVAHFASGKHVTIGTYKTMDKAIIVLDNICSLYKYKTVYVMPED